MINGIPCSFGGVIPTDTMDELARYGLSFTNIYSTALCSPTRAALMTGRNHHSAGFCLTMAMQPHGSARITTHPTLRRATPVPWTGGRPASAFDAPFDYFKQNANRPGGVRNNMVVSWPGRIADKGARATSSYT